MLRRVAYRRRKKIYKRLMLFVNISLMGPPLTHFLGSFGLLRPFPVPAGVAMFFLSAAAGIISAHRVFICWRRGSPAEHYFLEHGRQHVSNPIDRMRIPNPGA